MEKDTSYLNAKAFLDYHIKWPFKNRFYEILSRFFTSKSVLMDTINEMARDKEIIEQKTEKLKNINEKLKYEIEKRKRTE